MSIASNVIDENTKLGTARGLLREKLAANGIYYSASDSIFQLVRRWNMKYVDISFNTPYSRDIYAGAQISVGATVTDSSTDDPISGMPITVVSGGHTYDLVTGNDGVASLTLTVGEIGTTFQGTVYAGKSSDSWSYKVPAFADFSDYAGYGDTDDYEIVKYPSNITHTFEIVEVNYSENYNLTKQVTSGSVVMAIPKVYTNGIGGTNGIHMSVALRQKKDSNQGWGDCIALVNSKSLNHYRDTKILELGAYPGKHGSRYSGTDHVVRDLNVVSSQLTLDSQQYYFDLYYDNGYFKATIRTGPTPFYSYEADISDKITFDTFYPAIIIYEAGGHIQFESIYVEQWTHEEE